LALLLRQAAAEGTPIDKFLDGLMAESDPGNKATETPEGEVDKDVTDDTVRAYAVADANGETKEPDCPVGYHLLRTELQEKEGLVMALCNPCFGGCEHCTGPLEIDCTACSPGKKLFIGWDGDSKCLENCPECFVFEDGECVPDNTNLDCAHVATFHSAADLEKEPAACTALEDMQKQESGASLTQIHARIFDKEALLAISTWRSRSHADSAGRRRKSKSKSKSKSKPRKTAGFNSKTTHKNKRKTPSPSPPKPSKSKNKKKIRTQRTHYRQGRRRDVIQGPAQDSS
jgi:hypothetical protein